MTHASVLQSALFRLSTRICSALICALGICANANIITVTNTNDNGPGSLRQALTIANDGDTISFAVTGTVTLTSGGLPVNKNITISGPGADQLSIDGNQTILIFGVFNGNAATISGLTVRTAQFGVLNEGTLTVSNCDVRDNSRVGLFNTGILTASNCVISDNSGDGLYNDHATLSVSDCVITANSYSGIYNYNSHGPSSSVEHGNDRRDAKEIDGPSPGNLTIANTIISDNSEHGIYNDGGYVTILNSRLTGNSDGQGDGGGAISIGSFKTPGGVTVINSTISGNSSGAGGGIGISYGGVTLVNSTISGNSAGDVGGGISNASGGVQVINSTISGNSAGKIGGGIASSGGVHLTNSTISGNSAGSAGGIYYVQGQYPYTNEISNTIFNAGALGENIVNNGATVTSHGYNLSSDDGGGLLIGPGDQINTSPLLGPLQDNGGPTLTHLPMPGSPAIDAGDPSFTPPPDHDQRGACFYRVFGRRIDVGSVETQPRPRCVTPAPRPGP
jgi:hypothetical protein